MTETLTQPRKTRYAIVGTGGRCEMFRDALNTDFSAHGEIVGFCDVNRGRLLRYQEETRKATGRVVPTAQIREIHKSVSAVFPQIMGDFDTLELVDTEAGKTVLTKTAGARPVVQDSVLWDSFLNKGRV